MAAAASSSANPAADSQSSPAGVKQEQQPQDVKSEIFDLKEVKRELMEGVKAEKREPKEEPVEGVKDVNKEPKEEPVEDSNEANEESEEEPIVDMDDYEKEELERMKRYEADFKQYLMSKYFSDKTVIGGNIFDTKTNIGGETIAASRLPPYESFADPKTFLELSGKEPRSSEKTPTTSTSKGKSKAEDKQN